MQRPQVPVAALGRRQSEYGSDFELRGTAKVGVLKWLFVFSD
jgi:hypothetical protein